jgi:hypothetical protein
MGRCLVVRVSPSPAWRTSWPVTTGNLVIGLDNHAVATLLGGGPPAPQFFSSGPPSAVPGFIAGAQAGFWLFDQVNFPFLALM